MNCVLLTASLFLGPLATCHKHGGSKQRGINHVIVLGESIGLRSLTDLLHSSHDAVSENHEKAMQCHLLIAAERNPTLSASVRCNIGLL